jgi:hypothetical protein
MQKLDNVGEKGQFTEISGSFSQIKHIEYVDQNPIEAPVLIPTYIRLTMILGIYFPKKNCLKLEVICPNIFL